MPIIYLFCNGSQLEIVFIVNSPYNEKIGNESDERDSYRASIPDTQKLSPFLSNFNGVRLER